MSAGMEAWKRGRSDGLSFASARGGANHRRVRLQLSAEKRNQDVGHRPVLLVACGEIEEGTGGRSSEVLRREAAELSALTPHKRLLISQKAARTDTLAWTFTLSRSSTCTTGSPV